MPLKNKNLCCVLKPLSRKNLLPFRNKAFLFRLQHPDLPRLVPFLEVGQQTLLKPGLFLHLEHHRDGNQFHSVQIIPAWSKVVPSSVLWPWLPFVMFALLFQLSPRKRSVGTVFGFFVCLFGFLNGFIHFYMNKIVSIWCLWWQDWRNWHCR